MSPNQARSVALILNPTTGLVSPQYHIKFDDTFETVCNQVDPAHGEWKVKARLRKETNYQKISTTTTEGTGKTYRQVQTEAPNEETQETIENVEEPEEVVSMASEDPEEDENKQRNIKHIVNHSL